MFKPAKRSVNKDGEMPTEKNASGAVPTVKRSNGAILTMSVGVAVNFALFITKLFIGIACNSVSILSDAMNNCGDVLSCGIGVLSFVLIKKRSDSLAFGYGRLEYVADFLMAIIICVVGASFTYSAVERMILPSIMTFSRKYFIIILCTALIKVGLGVFYLYRNKKTGSGVLKASAIDSFIDVGITAMTLIGYSLDRAVNLRIDAIFGIIISVIMIINGVRLLICSIKILLGEKIKDEERADIAELCKKSSAVESVKGMNLHRYGAEYSELVVELVFTKGIDYGIIKKSADDISAEIESKFGYAPKICIARSDDEK